MCISEYRKKYNKTRGREWYYEYSSKPDVAARLRAHAMDRYTKKQAAQPAWLDKDQKSLISAIYWLAKDLEVITGERYHVDHIIPLKGKTVCGLHVPWNLQVLPSDINLAKNNRLLV